VALTPDAIRRGVVLLVRLPRDKARPAVVVRSDLLSELSYATVLPITSDLRTGVSMRVDLAPSAENGLRAASQVMVDWPQTIRFVDIGQAIGHLDMAIMRVITRQLAVVLGIGSSNGRPRRPAGGGGLASRSTPPSIVLRHFSQPRNSSVAPGGRGRLAGQPVPSRNDDSVA
jgi:mRNA interferase MazF